MSSGNTTTGNTTIPPPPPDSNSDADTLLGYPSMWIYIAGAIAVLLCLIVCFIILFCCARIVSDNKKKKQAARRRQAQRDPESPRPKAGAGSKPGTPVGSQRGQPKAKPFVRPEPEAILFGPLSTRSLASPQTGTREGSSYDLNAKVGKDDKKALASLQDVIKDERDRWLLVDALGEHCVQQKQESVDPEVLGMSLVALFANVGAGDSFLNRVIEHDLSLADSAKEAFAEEGFFAACFLGYAKVVGTKYIFGILGNSIDEICKERQERAELENVIDTAEELLKRIVNSSREMPTALKVAVANAAKFTSAQFDEEQASTVSQTLLLTLVFAPVIARPDRLGLVSPAQAKQARVRLGLAAKLLANLSRQEHFPSSKKAAPQLNAFIDKHGPRLSRWQSELAADATMAEATKGDSIDHVKERVPYEIVERALVVVRAAIMSQLKEISEAVRVSGARPATMKLLRSWDPDASPEFSSEYESPDLSPAPARPSPKPVAATKPISRSASSASLDLGLGEDAKQSSSSSESESGSPYKPPAIPSDLKWDSSSGSGGEDGGFSSS